MLNDCYDSEAISSSLILFSMINTYSLSWYAFFCVMIDFVIVEICVGLLLLYEESGQEFWKRNAWFAAKGGRTKAALKRKAIWICLLILLTYVGAEGKSGSISHTWFLHHLPCHRADYMTIFPVSVDGWVVSKRLHISVIGFSTAFGGDGVAV